MATWTNHGLLSLLLSPLKSYHKSVTTFYRTTQAFYSLNKLLQLPAPLPTLRGWAASPDFLLEIAKYALEAKPGTALECSSGCSTIVLARCMQLNGGGHVYSLEHDLTYAVITRRELERQELTEWATVIDAPLVEIRELPGHRWYSLESFPTSIKAELLVIDGPPVMTCKLARYPALPLLKERLAKNCHVLLDDASRDSEQEIVKRWMAEFSGTLVKYISCEKGCAELTLS